jgi:RNA polymerase sigma factor (sigma-70 family)
MAEPPQPAVPAREGDTGFWNAVSVLPKKQRIAVALRFACDMRHREIGEATGTTEEAARRNVHEGIKKLREVLT